MDAFENMFDPLDEADMSTIQRKQKSITKLFPTFQDRVKAVQNRGGVSLKRKGADAWNFEIASGTTDGVKYDAVVHFKDIESTLRKLATDRRLWTSDKKSVDYDKLAKKFLSKVDLQTGCSCPAIKFYGGDFLLSRPKYDAKYGDKENRPPDIRNPKQYGLVCKHIHLLFMTLNLYTKTISNWLEEFWGDVIKEVEVETLKKVGAFKDVAKELVKRKEGAEEEEVEVEKEEGFPEGDEEKEETVESMRFNESIDIDSLPPEQQKLATYYKPAKPKDMFHTSSFPGEEDFVKFWLLNDGTPIWVDYAHPTHAYDAGVDDVKLTDSGAIRVGSAPEGEMYLEYANTPNPEQTRWLAQLYYLHGIMSVVINHRSLDVKSRDHFAKILREMD